MTCEVIDSGRPGRCDGDMTPQISAVPWDATLRVVIWCDAALSALVALLGAASPLVAFLPVSPAAVAVLGVAVPATALLLAALGAVTAVLLAARVRAGHLAIPAGLRVPWPGAARAAVDGEVRIGGSAGCGIGASP